VREAAEPFDDFPVALGRAQIFRIGDA